MTAILTRYIGQTTCKPARIKATASMGQTVTVPRHIDADETDEQMHRRAAMALCEKMGWSGRMVGGGTADGWAWVFVPVKMVAALRAVEAHRPRYQAGGRGGEVTGAVSAAMDLVRDALGES